MRKGHWPVQRRGPDALGTMLKQAEQDFKVTRLLFQKVKQERRGEMGDLRK